MLGTACWIWNHQEDCEHFLHCLAYNKIKIILQKKYMQLQVQLQQRWYLSLNIEGENKKGNEYGNWSIKEAIIAGREV